MVHLRVALPILVAHIQVFDQLSRSELAAGDAGSRHQRVDFALGAAIPIILLISAMELEE